MGDLTSRSAGPSETTRRTLRVLCMAVGIPLGLLTAGRLSPDEWLSGWNMAGAFAGGAVGLLAGWLLFGTRPGSHAE